MKKSDV